MYASKRPFGSPERGRVLRRLVVTLLTFTACSRTGLSLYGEPTGDDPSKGGSRSKDPLNAPADASRSADADANATADADAAQILDGATPPAATSTDASMPIEPPPTGCVPREERCNGADDDCNGLVDDLPPVPCAGGGSRYCIAGRLSECPERCEVCMPGSERVCFLSYCTFWGAQTCTADGRGFSGCREAKVPSECEYAIKGNKKTRELEECCLENGYCCVDDFDLDNDGIRREMIGRCDDLSCR